MQNNLTFSHKGINIPVFSLIDINVFGINISRELTMFKKSLVIIFYLKGIKS
jgi:hypothetical protein